MQIKVYKAATMKEAMDEVKGELGVDAVILHTKKYKEGGFLGYGSKEVVEVTAAVEEEGNKKPPKKKAADKKKMPLPAVKPAAPILPPSVLSQYKTNGTKEGIEIAEKTAPDALPIAAPDFAVMGKPDIPVGAVAANMAPPLPPPSPLVQENTARQRNNAALPKNSRRVKKTRIIKAQDVTEQMSDAEKVQTEQNVEGNSDDAKKIQRLEDELAQMKALLAEVMSKEQPKNIVPLHEAMRIQEVDVGILNDMAGRSGAGETLVDWRTAEAKITLRSFITQVINCSGGISLAQKGPKIAALIGPTGVGKTTTLAKIAARFVLEVGAKTALITADTYRISAVEQLRTYSDIIGLPLEIVYSPEELRKAIRRHADKDLILIDTAGRSQHNEYQMQELKDFLRVNKRIEKHLVISATTKSRDAFDIMEKFSVCEPERIIFTKTDETKSVGLILNMLYQKDIALSYLANGQSVPDDIMPASAEALAELLLRE